jgi:nucleoside-diphosphate-sugar epimerase
MEKGIFITGGTGNTGQALLRFIAGNNAFRNARITCLCRPGGRGERLLPFGVKIVGGDASNAESLKGVYRGEQTVIHISSIFHAPAVLEGCAGMKRLIAISSTGVFSNHRIVVGKIKAAERAIEQSGIPFTILRPTMIYGTAEDRNISRFIRLIKKYPIVPVPGGGKSIFQPVHVEDLAACVLATLATEKSIGKSYNVPGGSAHSLREIVDIIAGILGKRVLTVPVPLGLAEAAVGLQEKLLSHPVIRREQIQRLREDKQYDYSEAAKDFDYAPRELRAGIEQEIREIAQVDDRLSHR